MKKKSIINKISKQKNKHSITIQLVSRCVFIIVCTVLFNWFVNVFFLENYYAEMKQQRLYEAYSLLSIHSLSSYGKTFDDEMNRMCNTYNISYVIVDSRSNIIKASGIDGEIMRNALRNIIISSDTSKLKILSKTDRYFFANQYDEITGMNYLIMCGTVFDGSFFLIRTAHEGIRDSVEIFNTFLFWVGAIGTLVGSVIIYLVSKKITNPIAELASLSERMAKLDFSKKYSSNYNNEIDLLGENFNNMSITLEKTIGELKSANAKLQEDVENKIRIDNMRKEFLSNVSHELKTPIALIRGYAEGLKEGISDDPETLDYYCDVIMDESEKMNHMVLQLMKLNSLEFGTNTPEYSNFDLIVLITNTINSNEILVREKEINVKFKTCEETLFIWADEFQIEEVIRNFFNNAMNHIGGNREIVLNVFRERENVKVTVYNTGENIPSDSIEFLWDKFYKVDKARTRAYGGSGIGLSIVKAIVEQHKGEYGVENKENGVEFWFSLPISDR